jgi:hypothetical protein
MQLMAGVSVSRGIATLTLFPTCNMQDINVPCGGPSNCTYTIQTGDTLAKVAAIYDLDVDAIETLNPDISARDLVLGQVPTLSCSPFTA